MIETLTQNIETVQTVLGALSVPAFVMVVTSLLKKNLEVYTPYIAVAIGVIIGLITTFSFIGFSVMSALVGIIFGAITGASAVGIKVIADGKPEAEAFDWEE